MIAGTVFTMLAAAVLVVTRWHGRHTAAAIAKVVASCGFLATAYAAGALTAGAYGFWIVAGLVLGWFGDVFLLARSSKRLFLMGLVSFLLGHVAYIIAMLAIGAPVPVAALWLLILLPIGVLFYRNVGSGVRESLRWGVVAYIGVISVMLAAGLSTLGWEVSWWLVPGSVLFYLSDIGVALDRFKPLRTPAYLWSLPLYYGGQLFFAWSVKFAVLI